MLRCLVGRCGKVDVAQPATSTFHPHYLLPVFQYFHFGFASQFVFTNSSQRHFYNYVGSLTASTVVFGAVFAIVGNHVFVVAQVQQSPHLAVAPQNNVTTSATIATIGATHCRQFVSQKMFATAAAMSAFGKYSDVVYKV